MSSTGKSMKANDNQLVLAGPHGCGKSHALQEIERRFRTRHPNARILKTGASQLVEQLLNHIEIEQVEAFEYRLEREFDLLLIDDVDLESAKHGTRDYLAGLFQRMADHGVHIVATATELPKQPNDALDGFLLSGRVRNIQPPGFWARVELVKQKAAELGVALNWLSCWRLAWAGAENAGEFRGAVTAKIAKNWLIIH